MMPSIQLSPNCTVELMHFKRPAANGPACPKCNRPSCRNGHYYSKKSNIQYYTCRHCKTYWSHRA